MAGPTLIRHGVTTSGMVLLLCVFFSSQGLASAPHQWQQLGQPVQYVYSKLTSIGASQLIFEDGSAWHTSQPGFGLASTPVLVFSTNPLHTGAAELWLHGFKLSARLSDGELKALNGRKIDVLTTEHNGSRLTLSDNKRLFVVERDRRLSTHWQQPFQAILTEDWQLVHLPTLQLVSVILLAD